MISYLQVVDPSSGQDMNFGEKGEIWTKGPHVMKGYFRNPKASAEMIDNDGWLHTGLPLLLNYDVIPTMYTFTKPLIFSLFKGTLAMWIQTITCSLWIELKSLSNTKVFRYFPNSLRKNFYNFVKISIIMLYDILHIL